MESRSITVAMCTYNCAKLVDEQLASLSAQTLLPTELVISDDASTDATIEHLERFAATAPFPVRIHRQPTNLGWRKNREQSVQHGSGEWIAICDADDVWKPQKLQRMIDAVAGRTGCRMVFCDADVVDANLQPKGYTAWQINRLGRDRQQRILAGDAFGALLSHTPVADPCLMFQRNLLRLALPFPPEWATDAWLVLVAAATGVCTLVPEPLQLYRQHSSNLAGGQRQSLWEKYRSARQSVSSETFAMQERNYRALLERVTAEASASVLQQIQARLKFAATRRTMRDKPWLRPWLVVREAMQGNYVTYGGGWRSAALDLLV